MLDDLKNDIYNLEKSKQQELHDLSMKKNKELDELEKANTKIKNE